LVKKILGEDQKPPKLGKKMIEQWSNTPVPDDARIAVYRLRGSPGENDTCVYDFVETVSYEEYNNKY